MKMKKWGKCLQISYYLTVFVLSAPCVPDQTVNTNLDPPTGFTIDIPGPVLIDGGFNTNPVVLIGSQLKVRLR